MRLDDETSGLLVEWARRLSVWAQRKSRCGDKGYWLGQAWIHLQDADSRYTPDRGVTREQWCIITGVNRLRADFLADRLVIGGTSPESAKRRAKDGTTGDYSIGLSGSLLEVDDSPSPLDNMIRDEDEGTERGRWSAMLTMVHRADHARVRSFTSGRRRGLSPGSRHSVAFASMLLGYDE